MRCVPLCFLEVLEVITLCTTLYAGGAGGDAMHCVLLCMLKAVEDVLYLSEVPKLMCCALLCMLEAVEGGFCLIEVPEVMRRVLLYMLERCGQEALFIEDVGGV